jgi:hypothetical protein
VNMPPLICFSPNVIDHTFPRSNQELEIVQQTLSSITSATQKEECVILLTQALVDFISELEWSFCWEVISRYPKVETVYRLLAELGLQQHGVLRINVAHVVEFGLHPLPKEIEPNAFSQTWSEELGRLWQLHSDRCNPGKSFIGVACTFAFGGQDKGTYDNPDNLPTFPLLGPGEIGVLEDSFEWDLPAGMHNRKVSFDDARKRISLLGGSVSKPKGSSHYQVRFAGARTWPLDHNIDPVPEDFLKELIPITGQELSVIKYVLLHGDWPKKILRLPS